MGNTGNSQTNSPLFSQIEKMIDSKKAYRTVEGNILTAAEGDRKKTFLLTSSVPGEGKTFTTLVMAKDLASHSNTKILLIEGNVHNPKLTSAFELTARGMGMYEYFSAECDLKDSIVDTGYKKYIPNAFI